MTCTLAENWKFYSVAVAVEGRGHSREWEPRGTRSPSESCAWGSEDEGYCHPQSTPGQVTCLTESVLVPRWPSPLPPPGESSLLRDNWGPLFPSKPCGTVGNCATSHTCLS